MKAILEKKGMMKNAFGPRVAFNRAEKLRAFGGLIGGGLLGGIAANKLSIRKGGESEEDFRARRAKQTLIGSAAGGLIGGALGGRSAFKANRARADQEWEDRKSEAVRKIKEKKEALEDHYRWINSPEYIEGRRKADAANDLYDYNAEMNRRKRVAQAYQKRKEKRGRFGFDEKGRRDTSVSTRDIHNQTRSSMLNRRLHEDRMRRSRSALNDRRQSGNQSPFSTMRAKAVEQAAMRARARRESMSPGTAIATTI